MGKITLPKKVKLIVGITYKDSNVLSNVEEFLNDSFGAFDVIGEEFSFSKYTGYYNNEMGGELLKIFYSFKTLINRDQLPNCKIKTNNFEVEMSFGDSRTINIDPGYISEASLILATTKNFAHRIYLDNGIFGDCHLIYEEEQFNPMPWTYPDYKDPRNLAYFQDVRDSYYSQLSKESEKKTVSYADAGVDISEGENAVKSIKEMVKRTYGKNVLIELGKFGGFYAPTWSDYTDPVIVSSVDGVGTKLKIAFMSGKHNTIGQCLVNHSVNDVLCCGAKPMFFLDYLAFGKLDTDMFAGVVEGLSKACEETGTALIGGETAEMPGFYQEGEYDISGTVVGIADRSLIIDGSKIKEGDRILGLPATGLHTNGYSLARRLFFETAGMSVDTKVPELGCTVGEELLKIHRCYLNEIFPLVTDELVNGLAHITGGGMLGNISRLLPADLHADIDWDSWEWLPVYKVMQDIGNVSDNEMRRVFNLGIGFTIIASDENTEKIIDRFNAEKIEHFEIGKMTRK